MVGAEAADRFSERARTMSRHCLRGGFSVMASKARVKGLKDTGERMGTTSRDAFKGYYHAVPEPRRSLSGSILNRITGQLLDSAFDTLWGGCKQWWGKFPWRIRRTGEKAIFWRFPRRWWSVSAGKVYIVGKRPRVVFSPVSAAQSCPKMRGCCAGLKRSVLPWNALQGPLGPLFRDACR